MSKTVVIVVLLAASQAIAFIDRVNLSVAGPELVHSGTLSAAWLGTLFSAFNWAYTLSLLIVGPLVDRIGAGRSLVGGLLLWSAATVGSGLSQAALPLVATRALVGVGEASMIPAGSRIIDAVVPRAKRALAVGTFFAGNKVGLALGIPVSSLLLARFGWHAVFFGTGALGLVWLLGWLLAYRPAPRQPAEPQTAREALRRWRRLLRRRTTWGVMIGQAGYLYLYFLFVSWLPGYLRLQRHLDIVDTGVAGMMPFVVGVACTLLGGWLGDRLIAGGRSTRTVRKTFAVGGLLAAAVFTAATAFAPDTGTALAGLTLAVASFSFCTAHVNALPLDVAPAGSVASLTSLQNFGGNLGGSLAPILTGALVSWTGSFQLPLLFAAAVGLVLGCGGYGLVLGGAAAEDGADEIAPTPFTTHPTHGSERCP